jgi:hypothetical protein
MLATSQLALETVLDPAAGADNPCLAATSVPLLQEAPPCPKALLRGLPIADPSPET